MPVSLFEPYRPDSRGVLDRDARIRPARPGDVGGIEAIARTRQDVAGGFAERVDGWVRDPEGLVLVAELGGGVVGWAMLARWLGYDDVPDGWYVSALTVHPDARRRRIGDRLAGALLEWPPASGSTVRSVVNAGNLASIALHRRHGFVEVRRAATLAGITFVGGTGVLLAAERGERVPV